MVSAKWSDKALENIGELDSIIRERVLAKVSWLERTSLTSYLITCITNFERCVNSALGIIELSIRSMVAMSPLKQYSIGEMCTNSLSETRPCQMPVEGLLYGGIK